MPANGNGRFTAEMQGGAGSQGVLAEDIEVELDRIVDKTRQHTNDKMDIGDVIGIVLARRFDGDL